MSKKTKPLVFFTISTSIINDYLLKKIDTHASMKRLSASGRPRTACTADSVNVVAELVMSQENQTQTHRTIRQIAREFQSI